MIDRICTDVLDYQTQEISQEVQSLKRSAMKDALMRSETPTGLTEVDLQV